MTHGETESSKATVQDLEVILNQLNSGIENLSYGSEDIDKVKTVLQSLNLKSLLQIKNILEDVEKDDTKVDHIKLCLEIIEELNKNSEDPLCKELKDIITSPNFRCFIEAYENIVFETYKSMDHCLPKLPDTGPPMRVVGLTKIPKEPLGVTLAKHPDGCVYIQRILKGTMVERQALFHVGDIIKEINGEQVSADPQKVQELLQSIDGSITVKCIPAFKDSRGKCQVYLRCHFDYSPNQDELFPKNEVGLSFQKGDILEVTDQSDDDWWQAFLIDEPTKTGIVPSLKLEQTRRSNSAQNKNVKKRSKKEKKKIMYRTCHNSMFDCFDVRLYEEVTKMPAVEKKVIALVGAQGVGRRTLKNRLLENYPDRYVAVVPDTSRTPRENEVSGRGYNFLDRKEMFSDISTGKYFEWGEHNGDYYGSRLNSIRDIVNSGKTCVLDCDASALKYLKTAEFMPLIVFVEAPGLGVLTKNNQKDTSTKKRTPEELKSMIEESNDINGMYHHYFDTRIVNEDTDKSYELLREFIDKQSTEAQWVPISWVY